jgi:hypothetical protein
MVISLSGYLPGSIFSREGDIASAQNLLISFKPIICKLNYSHVIKYNINEMVMLFCFVWVFFPSFSHIHLNEVYINNSAHI